MPNDDPWEPNSTGEIISAVRHNERSLSDLTPDQRSAWSGAMLGVHLSPSTAETISSVLRGERPRDDLAPDDREAYDNAMARQWAPTGQSGSGERAWREMQAEQEGEALPEGARALLTPRLRTIALLWVQDKTQGEIGGLLTIKPTSVGKRVSEIRVRLRGTPWDDLLPHRREQRSQKRGAGEN